MKGVTSIELKSWTENTSNSNHTGTHSSIYVYQSIMFENLKCIMFDVVNLSGGDKDINYINILIKGMM